MVKIFDNTNHKIKNIYKNCITNGDIHNLRGTNSLNEIIKNSKNIISKHFGEYKKIQKAQEEIDVKDYVEIIMKIKNDFTNSDQTNEIIIHA